MPNLINVNGAILVEERGIIVGCVQKNRYNEDWSFQAVAGNPYNISHAESGDGTLSNAMQCALKYRPHS